MTLNLDSIFRQVDELHSQMIEWRRDFHQYPEIGFEEERTSKIVANLLKDWGIEVKTNVAKTGVVGLIEGRGEGNKTVALRADMDALPMQEENEVSYKSKVDGRMPACGHDGHTAMLLGAAKVLSSNREYINGNVKLIFQPAEEGPGTGGALPMIKEGVLDDVDAIFGLHLSTTIPTGQLGINMGPGMASTDVFEITMIGKGGHAGYPHEAVDAIAMGIRVFTEIQYMVSRHVDPMEPLVVSIGTFKGGFVSNVIAERCEITGTIRTYSDNLRKKIIENIKDIANHVANISGGECEVNIIPGLPPLINDLNIAQFSIDVGKQVLGADKVNILEKASMGGEDFAYYLQKIPGAFMWLGARNEGKGFVNQPHHPKFDFDEDALALGCKMHIGLALEYLKNQ
ncbi:MAG: amidohydrolase [Tissierellia bacterium]|nr:amidohydrolase [Tissierellia bacterium]